MSDQDANCVILSDGVCGVTLHAPDRVWEQGLEHRVDLLAGPLQGTITAVDQTHLQRIIDQIERVFVLP